MSEAVIKKPDYKSSPEISAVYPTSDNLQKYIICNVIKEPYLNDIAEHKAFLVECKLFIKVVIPQHLVIMAKPNN
jgi:hypothetical protein